VVLVAVVETVVLVAVAETMIKKKHQIIELIRCLIDVDNGLCAEHSPALVNCGVAQFFFDAQQLIVFGQAVRT
jgi:hypothetical protein